MMQTEIESPDLRAVTGKEKQALLSQQTIAPVNQTGRAKR